MNYAFRPLGDYQTNCFLIWDDDACIVIDPGYPGPDLDALLTRTPVPPQAILLTHAHFDHVGAAEQLRAEGAALYVHPAERDLPHALAPLDFSGALPLSDGDQITAGTLSLRVIHTPGHTPGSCCFLTGSLLLSGDTLFAGSCGRMDLGGSETDMMASLKRLHDLPDDYTVLPGHGPATTLSRERARNPWMREACAR